MSQSDFCLGNGYVMGNGFAVRISLFKSQRFLHVSFFFFSILIEFCQLSWTTGNYCILWLFQSANINTLTKYILSLIGTFLMGMGLELLRHYRGVMNRRMSLSGAYSPFTQDLVQALSYGVQMVLAYLLMLIVMTFETFFFLAIVLGLSVGHLVTLQMQRAAAADDSTQNKHVPLNQTLIGHSPCCEGN
jgi:hypothetical protein